MSDANIHAPLCKCILCWLDDSPAAKAARRHAQQENEVTALRERVAQLEDATRKAIVALDVTNVANRLLLGDRAALSADVAAEKQRVEAAKKKAEQYANDWYTAKSEFGDAMALLRTKIRESEARADMAEAATVEAIAAWIEARAHHHDSTPAEIRNGDWKKRT